tara:strand:+ start:1550 stop:1735 length:186 start_codon:yes stop_codon:yes gene_type:complete
MRKYTVKARDERGNVSIMSDVYDNNEALEMEALLKINNPMMYIWIEEHTYWSEEDERGNHG